MQHQLCKIDNLHLHRYKYYILGTLWNPGKWVWIHGTIFELYSVSKGEFREYYCIDDCPGDGVQTRVVVCVRIRPGDGGWLKEEVARRWVFGALSNGKWKILSIKLPFISNIMIYFKKYFPSQSNNLFTPPSWQCPKPHTHTEKTRKLLGNFCTSSF
jgi:hypothetical protein